MQKTGHCAAVTVRVAEHLKQILQHAGTVDGLVAQIATASSEQGQGVTQMNTAVSQMDKVTQQTAATAEESAAAAEELNAQAQEISALVQELKALVNGHRPAATTATTHSDRPTGSKITMLRPPLRRPTRAQAAPATFR